MSNKFIADVHLGKLARLLRLLGFDTRYKNDYTALDLLHFSHKEDRVLLSRNISFNKNKEIIFLHIADENPLKQLKHVIEHFNLKDQLHPFSRCMVCNGSLLPVKKENIVHLLEKNSVQYFDEFWQCENCRHIYWKGSHYSRMLSLIKEAANKN